MIKKTRRDKESSFWTTAIIPIISILSTAGVACYVSHSSKETQELQIKLQHNDAIIEKRAQLIEQAAELISINIQLSSFEGNESGYKKLSRQIYDEELQKYSDLSNKFIDSFWRVIYLSKMYFGPETQTAAVIMELNTINKGYGFAVDTTDLTRFIQTMKDEESYGLYDLK